ncbi:MAG: protein kinase [Planctomycetes bacterium]|nr:protein kinase [Planctomycetota bacterium]
MPVFIPDDALARVLVERKLLTHAQLERCRAEQEASCRLGLTRLPLGTVAGVNGFLDGEQLQALLAEETLAVPAEDFAELRGADAALLRRAADAGLLAQNRVLVAMRIQERLQQASGLPVRLGEILVVQGYLKSKNLARLCEPTATAAVPVADGRGEKAGEPETAAAPFDLEATEGDTDDVPERPRQDGTKRGARVVAAPGIETLPLPRASPPASPEDAGELPTVTMNGLLAPGHDRAPAHASALTTSPTKPQARGRETLPLPRSAPAGAETLPAPAPPSPTATLPPPPTVDLGAARTLPLTTDAAATQTLPAGEKPYAATVSVPQPKPSARTPTNPGRDLPEEVALAARDPANAFGKYVLLRELGRGGMGIVYKAYDRTLRRTVALKMLLTGERASPEEVERFQREARAAAALQHEHIVAIYEVDIERGKEVPYFTMEFVEGKPLDALLRDVLEKKESVSPREAAALLRDVAMAVDHAHGQGIVHRDLKPANILLVSVQVPEPSNAGAESQEDAAPPAPARAPHSARGTHALQGTRGTRVAAGTTSSKRRALRPGGRAAPARTLVPKVADFGLAKHLQSTSGLSVTGQVMGTPAYMPPEQALGRVNEIDARSDVYALGATLYEVLTLQPPFAGETALAVLSAVVRKEPRPPRSLVPRLDRDLETICLKCLEKDPDRRYESALALAEDLDSFVQGDPIRARPISGMRRAWRGIVRRKALSAAVLFGLALVGVAGAYQARIAREEQAKREKAAEQVRLALAEPEPERALALFGQALGNDSENAEAKAGVERTKAALALVGETQDAMKLARELAQRDRDWRRDVAARVGASKTVEDLAAILAASDKRTAEIGAIRRRALVALEQVLAKVPDHADALLERALLEELEFKLVRSEELVEKLLARDPRNHRGALLLVRLRLVAYLERKAPPFWIAGGVPAGRVVEPAQGPLAAGAREEPRTRETRERLKVALDALEGMAGAPPEAGQYAHAVRDLLEGRYREAEAGLTRVLDAFLDEPFAVLFRAGCRRSLGDLQGAEADYTRAIAMGRHEAPTWLDRGTTFLCEKKYAEAIGDFDRAAKTIEEGSSGPAARLAEFLPVIHNNRGLARLEKGEVEEALGDFTEAILADARNARPLVNRGLARAAKLDLERAILDYSKALELEPALEDAYLSRGKAYHALGKPDEALADYSKALAANPRCARAYALRAQLHQSRMEFDAWLEDAEKAVAADPGLALAHCLRGWALVPKQRFDEALASLGRAVELDPTLADAYYSRGLVEELLGRDAEAKTDFEAFLTRAPKEHQLAGDARARLKKLGERLLKQ